MRGCAQAAVKATLEVAAHNGPRFPHFPQALLRKKFLEIFWGYRLSSVSSKEKSVRRYLKSPPDLPKVPTPGGRCRTLYLKSPPWRIFEGRVIHRCAGWGLASGGVDR